LKDILDIVANDPDGYALLTIVKSLAT